MINQIKKELKKYIDAEKAYFYPRFFKAGKGEYGEGDQFIGVTVPNLRKVAKQFKEADLKTIKVLIYSPIHEHRLLALFILVGQFKDNKKEIYNFYYYHLKQVNNWDLVDSSAHKIMGAYLIDKDRQVLYELAKSKALWDRRIAMISCLAFIQQNDFSDALAIAQILVNDSHDLMHKAVGWMLREIGKRDQKIEEIFLRKHYQNMPRTMLRYAIEKFEEGKRQKYLKGAI